MMTYKGYAGQVMVDPEAGIIHGRVIGLRDVITFEGETVEEAKQAFRDSVDDYLEFCEELGRPPEKPYSGTFNARLGADLHRRLAILAEAESVSINEKLRQITEGALREQLGEKTPKQPTKPKKQSSTQSPGGAKSSQPPGVTVHTTKKRRGAGARGKGKGRMAVKQ